MCGTGFGFSVEKEEVEKLPKIPVIKSALGNEKIPIFDSKAGWADSVKMLMNNLYDGQNIYFDFLVFIITKSCFRHYNKVFTSF